MSKILAALAVVGTVAQARTSDEWKKRNIYQVLTDRFAGGQNGDLHNYLGGTWNAMSGKLDYIKNLGFDAIWISPVVDNIAGGYHGYWAKNWEEVNAHFGSSDDLKNLVKAAHAKDIWVMVDVVANHVGPVDMDFSEIYPLNQGYHYHYKCNINWSDQHSVEYCRLANLPDLNQENDYVRGYLKDWIKQLVIDYDFDGIRIDTIPEVPPDFWSEYGESAGVFQMGECFNGDPNYVGPYQQHLTALFNYPMFYTIRDVWQHEQSMYNIRNRYNQEEGPFKDIDLLGVFVDNHDNARFLNGNGNHQVFKGALAFALTSRGIPFTYYGSEQGFAGGNDPYNREPLWNNFDEDAEIYKFIQTINTARTKTQSFTQTQVEKYVTDDFYAFSRGSFLVALTNQSSNQVHYTIPNAPFSEGAKVCNIFFPTTDCQNISSGNIDVYLDNGEVKIYVNEGDALAIQEEILRKNKEFKESLKKDEDFLQW